MIKECPECKEKIDILHQQAPNTPSATDTVGFAQISTFYTATYPSTTKTYKCSNPKCWVTKITESWE